jgi:ABC-type sulfate transport system substrate-binding protein
MKPSWPSRNSGADQFEIIAPSLSILAEPPVTVVDKIADRRGTREVSEAYLNYLYSEEGQEIAAHNFYRPRLAAIKAKYADKFPKIELFTIDEAFGGWNNAQQNPLQRRRGLRPDLQVVEEGVRFQVSGKIFLTPDT